MLKIREVLEELAKGKVICPISEPRLFDMLVNHPGFHDEVDRALAPWGVGLFA